MSENPRAPESEIPEARPKAELPQRVVFRARPDEADVSFSAPAQPMRRQSAQPVPSDGADIAAPIAAHIAPPPADKTAQAASAVQASPLTPAQGGWAALILLVIQYTVVGLAQYWRAPLGGAMLLAGALVLLGYFAFLPYPSRLLRADERWRTRPRLGVTLGAYVLGSLASSGMMLFGSSLWPAALSEVPHYLSKGSDQMALLLAAGLVIPLNEELAFRGFLLRGLERARGPLFAALLSALLFSLGHGAPLQVLAIFPLAWTMARAVQYTGSLWTSVIIHALNNSVASLVWMLTSSGTIDSALGGAFLDTGVRVPLGLGVAGLLVSLAALSIATAWLKPLRAASAVKPAPRVWTVSTLLLLLLTLTNVGFNLRQLLFTPHPSTF